MDANISNTVLTIVIVLLAISQLTVLTILVVLAMRLKKIVTAVSEVSTLGRDTISQINDRLHSGSSLIATSLFLMKFINKVRRGRR